MDLKLEGKHVVITGASGGVGLVAAQKFLEVGAKVSMQFNSNHDSLSSLLDKYPKTALAHKADLTSESDVSALFQVAGSRFGTANVLIVCHGIWPSEDVPVKDMPLERWRHTMSVNLDGTFLVCREFLRGVDQAVLATKQLSNVAIVMVGSTAGKFGEAFHADYSCTKSAIMQGLTLSLKNEIVRIFPSGRVNVVSSGWIRTAMAEKAMKDPHLLYQALASSPLKKVSEPIDVVNAILFLSSEAASGNITGMCLDVNAGMEGRVLNKLEEFA